MTKAQLQSDNAILERQLQGRDEQIALRRKEADGLRAERDQVARLLIQERRDLLARVRKLDILIRLSGGIEDGGSPSITRFR